VRETTVDVLEKHQGSVRETTVDVLDKEDLVERELLSTL